MKKTLFIVLLFVFACHQSDDKTIAFLNEGIERCNRDLSICNDKYYTDAESSTAENPLRAKQYKIIIDSLRVKSAKIQYGMQQIAQLFQKDYPDKNNYSERTYNRKTKSKIIELNNSLIEYKDFINKQFPNDTIIQKYINERLNITKVQLKDYTLPQFYLLENKVQNLDNFILFTLTRKMQNPRFRANKIEAVVIPKEKYLYQGEIYNAELYLLALDTTANIKVEVENKSLNISDYRAIYIDSVSKNVGKYTRNGLFRFANAFGENYYDFPFTINYQIKDK